MAIRWKLISLIVCGAFLWSLGTIAVYEMFFRIKFFRVLPDGTVEYLTDCPTSRIDTK